MISSNLIRLVGLAAMVGGAAWTTVWLLGDLLVRHLSLGFIGRAIQTSSIQGPVLVLLVVGAMVAIATLHTLQSQRDALLGTLVASLTAFVGLVMGLVSVATSPGPEFILLIMGLGVVTVGIVALEVVTIRARMLPRWCGATLIVWGPAFVCWLVNYPVTWGGILAGVSWLWRATPSSERGRVCPSSPTECYRRIEVYRP